MTSALKTQNPVSSRQRKLIGTLLDEKLITEDVADELTPMILDMVTAADAGKVINLLLKQPREDGMDTTRKDPRPGYYLDGDSLVRVVIGKRDTWYAQRADLPRPGSGRTMLRWEYIGKRVRIVGDPVDTATADRHIGFDTTTGVRLDG